MRKRLRKFAAAVLVTAMLAQQCIVPSLAEETSGDPQVLAEQQDEAAAAAETTAAETSATEAPVTEASATEAPATEAATEAPATEAAVTEAATEAPVTEAATEAAAQQAEEAPAAETAVPETTAATEAKSSSEEADEEESESESEEETETESETERSERRNTGAQISIDTLVANLSGVLPYLFAAGNVNGSEADLADQKILSGSDGQSQVSALSSFSTTLADAQSSSDVAVINIYADEDGNLDSAQLTDVFPDGVIDVTNQYYVVNIIADSANQSLSFSGYQMVMSGQTVSYTEESQVGDIVYNFAAMSGDSFTNYTGNLSLGGGLQGTVLAPTASVSVSSIAGAVYANAVNVADSADLLRIVFATGAEAIDSSTEAETESEAETVVETESETEIETETETANEVKPLDTPKPDVTVTVKVYYKDFELEVEDEQETSLYITLTPEESEDVITKKINFSDVGGTAKFEDLDPEVTYSLTATDEAGNPLEGVTVDPEKLEFEDGKDVEIVFTYSDSFPKGFSYTEDVTFTLGINVTDYEGKAYDTDDKFYVGIYSASTLDEVVSTNLSNPIDLTKSSDFTKEVTASVTFTDAKDKEFYIAERDKNGDKINERNFAYSITYSGDNKNYEKVTVGFGESKASVEISNQLKDTKLQISVVDSSGDYLKGAELVILDKSGKAVKLEDEATFKSKSKKIRWENEDLDPLNDGEEYTLREISAPDGYSIAEDQEFTFKKGFTTVVTLTNSKLKTTEYSLTVKKLVYVEEEKVYNFKGEKFYAALFSDEKKENRVSDVKEFVYENDKGWEGSLSFENLEEDTYYLVETDKYGNLLKDTEDLEIEYLDKSKEKGHARVEINSAAKSRTIYIKNIYSSFPKGFYYYGTITIEKKVVNSSDNAQKVSDTFYANVYADKEKRDKNDPINYNSPIELELKDASSSKASKAVMWRDDVSHTFYISETDEKGTREIKEGSTVISKESKEYILQEIESKVKLENGGNQTVTITNQATGEEDSSGSKISVTLYLTKRTYNGSALEAVTDTFYIGLFKDEECTQLYKSSSNPIKVVMENQYSKPLRVPLTVPTNTTIYIAETDEEGNALVKDGSGEFEYKWETNPVDPVVTFTENGQTETVIIANARNASAEEMAAIGEELGEYGDLDEDGDGSYGSAQTGDETPLAGTMAVMAAALSVIGWTAARRRRKA